MLSDIKDLKPDSSGGAAEDGDGQAFHYPPAISAGYLVRSAHRAFQRALENRIAPRGVTRGQWYFLRVLWEEDGLTQRELSARTGMTEPTTVVALNSMEKADLIRRVRSNEDRRKMHVHLTDKGKRIRGALLPLAKEVNDLSTEGVSAKDMEAFRRALRQMVDNLEKAKR